MYSLQKNLNALEFHLFGRKITKIVQFYVCDCNKDGKSTY